MYTVRAIDFRAATPVAFSVCQMTHGTKLRMNPHLIHHNFTDQSGIFWGNYFPPRPLTRCGWNAKLNVR